MWEKGLLTNVFVIESFIQEICLNMLIYSVIKQMK